MINEGAEGAVVIRFRFRRNAVFRLPVLSRSRANIRGLFLKEILTDLHTYVFTFVNTKNTQIKNVNFWLADCYVFTINNIKLTRFQQLGSLKVSNLPN